MKGSTFFKAASLLSSLFAPIAQAQEKFTHEETGIEFLRQTVSDGQTTGGYQWGYALPAEGNGDAEYIGYMVGSLREGRKGWSGVSHGGGMPNSLLMVAFPNDAGNAVQTRFVYAGGYVAPEDYMGNATLKQISSTINDTHFELVYHCQWCWVWNQNGAERSQLPDEVQVIGWAQHNDVPGDQWVFHENGQSQFGMPVADARSEQYEEWAQLGDGPEPTPGPTPSGGPTPTPTPTGPTSCQGMPAPTGSFDYIVVGAGAGGIPVADKLSEAGKSVLLLEKGPPSLGRFNGSMKPEWLEGTDLTRFDVPGLCNQIWHDSVGIACTDIDQMAGCVLGGGTAVNAALWWRPVPVDWDYNFPEGWKASDMEAPTEAVFKRIPGTDTPSMDGKRYKQEGYEVLSGVLGADGWKEVTANDVPSQKNRVYSHSPFMYENAQRQGPIGTYLVTALERDNFQLWMNTKVRRVVREGAKATGVELDGGNGGYCGTVNLNEGGRVILSAGAFGSPKLLFRSGIGPTSQLNVVKNSVQDGPSFINESDWINLPVGQNLNDHVNTDLVVSHPNISFYDFYEAWDDPIEKDKDMYLNERSGILATSAPNIGPLAWEVIEGSDGVDRSIQWTARVEGPGANDTHHMTISQYLGRGTNSRGSLSINGALGIYVSTPPYLRTQEDTAAVIAGINSMKKAIEKNPAIKFQVPPPNVTVEEYVASLPKTPGARRANHWLGSAKIGADSGLDGGSAVVDLDTKVYGTDNIHVVDASIFPGHIVTNPTSYIVTVGEHAAAKILALGSGSGENPETPETPAEQAEAYQQCGGNNWTGPTQCVESFECIQRGDWYSQCMPS